MGANMGPTWVLSALDGPYVGLMNLAIRVVTRGSEMLLYHFENGYAVLIFYTSGNKLATGTWESGILSLTYQ